MRAAGLWRLVAMLLAAAPIASAMAPSFAQPEEQVVYWPIVTDGTEYRRISSPPQAGPLLVLADTENLGQGGPE